MILNLLYRRLLLSCDKFSNKKIPTCYYEFELYFYFIYDKKKKREHSVYIISIFTLVLNLKKQNYS